MARRDNVRVDPLAKIDGAKYAEDKPKNCRFCYYWQTNEKGCRRSECFYLIKNEKKSVCEKCAYWRGMPCVGYCMKNIVAGGVS